ncbi:hypothetical protein [Oryzifoliimicrobium ureilyticus]|uniref:hypothetical protein n=1 Tax=Oryzifoliimicrobium ureilyticus TaxID=3113724 RepID=UPI0030764126
MPRPISDEEIKKATSPVNILDAATEGTAKDQTLVIAAWDIKHNLTLQGHNETFKDQAFLRTAWEHLTKNGHDTLASNMLAHFLGGTGKEIRFSLKQLFAQDQGVVKKFNAIVGAQIYKAEQEGRRKGLTSQRELDDFLKANLKNFDGKMPNPMDLRKDYGPLTFPYSGHVQIEQGDFHNAGWKNATGALTLFWIYAGRTTTSGYRQYRVFAWCLKQYKWHPFENRFTRLVHIAAENAKSPEMDRYSLPPLPSAAKPSAGMIKLGPETIGRWRTQEAPSGSGRLEQQTTFNPAREFKIIFEPGECIVPVYVPQSASGSPLKM